MADRVVVFYVFKPTFWQIDDSCFATDTLEHYLLKTTTIFEKWLFENILSISEKVMKIWISYLHDSQNFFEKWFLECFWKVNKLALRYLQKFFFLIFKTIFCVWTNFGLDRGHGHHGEIMTSLEWVIYYSNADDSLINLCITWLVMSHFDVIKRLSKPIGYL